MNWLFSLVKKLPLPTTDNIRYTLCLVLALGVPAFIIFLLWAVPELQVTYLPEDLSSRDVATLQDSFRKTMIQIIGGFVVFFGIALTWRRVTALEKQVQVTEEGQITERFTEAIKLLASIDLYSKLGGIYALERIAKDSPEDHWTIMEVLTAYIRKESPWEALGPAVTSISEAIEIFEKGAKTPVSPDIRAALTVLGRREHKSTEKHNLDLSNSNLACMKLPKGMDFSGIDFSFSNLFNTELNDCNLRSAEFYQTVLYLTSFENSVLDKVSLVDASWVRIIVKGASLNDLTIKQSHIKDLYGLTDKQEETLNVSKPIRTSQAVSVIVGPAPPDSNEEEDNEAASENLNS